MALTILTAKDVNDPSRTASVNSAIAQRGSNTTQAPGGVDLAPLSKQQKTLNRENALTYFLDVLRLYCLPGLGCIHARNEWFSATRSLDHPPEVMLPCTNNCHVCTGRHRKYFLPIVHREACSFLRSNKFVDAMSITLT